MSNPGHTLSRALKGALLVSVLTGLSGCSLLPPRHADEVVGLLHQLDLCQYSEPERDAMFAAAKAGNKLPFPLVYCEGERSPAFQARWLAERATTEHRVLGAHFEPDGYGAALVQVTLPGWGALCQQVGVEDNIACSHLVLGINAPHMDPVSPSERLRLLSQQDQLATIDEVPRMQDTFLMPVKRAADGRLIPNWVTDAGATRANRGLADQLGVPIDIKEARPYSQHLELLTQDDLAPQFRGVFYFTTPEHIDYAARPAPPYSIPLRRGVPTRGFRVTLYRALPN
ncbi:hypothetical protein KUV56_15680 [Ferrimonas balearica]|uniref:hypothetical protein n=1 Tax=Ferrimonas balearica TaxID=44012 RepID=UPI001C570FB6|nr:hypothetical protein [Ferrimonas balearica]MBW3140935.1 hypothetical protein [Ferrimonas balearica]